MRRALILLAISTTLLQVAACRCDQDRADPVAPRQGSLIVRCPVCGLEFDRSEAVARAEHLGETYYFLLEDHAQAFRQAPADYLKKP